MKKRKKKLPKGEELHPSWMKTDTGDIWVFAPWIKNNCMERPSDMRIMASVWIDSNDRIVAMTHQSLQ